MKSLPILALCAAITASTGAFAGSVPASAWDAPSMPDMGAGVRAGNAPIDQALARIIPAPYKIELDRSVSSNTVLVWAAGENWMTVLKRAIAPLGLVADPDWSRNTVRIVRVPSDVPATPRGAVTMPLDQPERVGLAASGSNPFMSAPTSRHAAGASIRSAGVMPASRLPVASDVAAPPVAKAPVPKHELTPMPAPSKAYTIPVGRRLSDGLADYAKTFGWQLRWQVSQDYVLDAPLPIPDLSLKDGLKYVLRAYQAQGGLLNVAFVLAEPNRVAVARPTTAPEHR